MPDRDREIRRGEIYLVDWNPSRGSEQAGNRPALIIQNDIGNKASPNTIVAGISTRITESYPFVVHCKSGEGGLIRDSAIDLATIMTVSKTRLGVRFGQLGDAKMAEVDEAIKTSLGLS
jgi:mRNA interferase MazF